MSCPETSWLLSVCLVSVLWSAVSGLDCYDCYSDNHSDTSCADPFHPAFGYLSKDCTQRKTDTIGSYPAKFCVKLIGRTVDGDIEMVYRGCSLESLDSQCGDFKFEDTRYSGCVTSCTDHACNDGVTSMPIQSAFYVSLVFIISGIAA